MVLYKQCKNLQIGMKIATEQVFIPNAGHINSESGYDTFEDIVSYL